MQADLDSLRAHFRLSPFMVDLGVEPTAVSPGRIMTQLALATRHLLKASATLVIVATRAVPDKAPEYVADGTVAWERDPLGPHYRLRGNKMWISVGEHELTENVVHLVLAWLWLNVALAMHRSGAEVGDFGQGKLAAMRYFFAYELPKIDAGWVLCRAAKPWCVNCPTTPSRP